MAVVNFPPRQIGPFMSEVLTLGVTDNKGAVTLLVQIKKFQMGDGCIDKKNIYFTTTPESCFECSSSFGRHYRTRRYLCNDRRRDG